MGLQFEKWEGTGNDFILVDARQAGALLSSWTPDQIQRLCDRRLGVGADGVVEVSTNGQGHLVVDFRNPDGSRSFCGNGTRAALAWAHKEGLVHGRDGLVIIEAVDGPIAVNGCVDGAQDPCAVSNCCFMSNQWNKVNDTVRDALDGVSLAELIDPSQLFPLLEQETAPAATSPVSAG